MDSLEIGIGIALLISFIVFAVYSSLSIRHAARFRYLSARTVYLTVFYVAVCSALILLSIASYIWLIAS